MSVMWLDYCCIVYITSFDHSSCFFFQGEFKPEKYVYETECDLPNAEIYKFTGFMWVHTCILQRQDQNMEILYFQKKGFFFF